MNVCKRYIYIERERERKRVRKRDEERKRKRERERENMNKISIKLYYHGLLWHFSFFAPPSIVSQSCVGAFQRCHF